MIKAIIFDFDGVVVESVDIKTKAFAKLFESEDKGVVRKVLNYHLSHVGVSRYEKFRYIYKNILHRILTQKVFKELCQRFSKLVLDEVVGAPYVKGAKEFLDNNYFYYKYFVVSATPQEEIEDIIKKRGIPSYFTEVYGAPANKVNIVRKIIRDNQLKPDKVVYIGDALSDYHAAKYNSVNFIARVNNNELIFEDIDCLKIRNLGNLKNILESNYGL